MRTGVAVEAAETDGIASYQEILNAVGIQQPQKIAKVRG
jgi:hypothetical protein